MTTTAKDPQKILNNKLLRACKSGNLKKIKEHLENGADFYCQNNLPFHYACYYGHLKCVQYLFEQKAHLGHEGKSAYTLSSCVYNGFLDILQFLFDKLEHIDQLQKDSALEVAASYGHLNCVEYLVKKGTNPNNSDNSALQASSYRGNLDIFKFLLSSTKEVSQEDFYNCLHAACFNGHLDVTKFIVEENNIDPKDIQYGDCLFTAINAGQQAIASYLILEQDCDPIEILKTITPKTWDENSVNTVNWCEKYIQTKELNNKLNSDLNKDSNNIKRKKI